MLGTYHMQALLEALADLHHIHNASQLYAFVLNRCGDVLKAQGGTFYSVFQSTGELYPEASRGVPLVSLQEMPFKMSLGIAGWVATNRSAALVENAQLDERFNRAVDVLTGVKTRSVICVPIVRQDKILGVVELVNRTDGIFRPADLEFLQHLSNQVGIAWESCKLYEKTENLLAYTDSVINSLTGGFISTDVQGVVTRCNPSACRILEIDEKDVLDKPLLKSIPQYSAFSAILDATQKNQSPVLRQEIELKKTNGSTIKIGYSTFIIRRGPEILGAGMIFQDLTRFVASSVNPEKTVSAKFPVDNLNT
ncbi:MAG: hypothetical protein KCHDKBKB_02198 [Elusimicrobia bacterium]|nr:hypothetical protein [Elusimicrobiota bacterium]